MPARDPAAIFREQFRRLKPRTTVPNFELSFRPYASLRATARFRPDSATIQAHLSDMLKDAPSEVLAALARILLSKLYHLKVPHEVLRRYKLWTHTQRVQERMVKVRRERGRKHLLPPTGAIHDLEELFDELNARHFEGRLRKPRLGWSPSLSRKRLGHYDPAHDVIVISRIFDRSDVPKLVLRFVLFHEMLHVKHPAEIRGGRRIVHTPEFRAEERAYPDFEAIKRLLRTL